MRRIALFTILSILVLAGCKDKPQAPIEKPAKAVVEEYEPDTTFVEEVMEETPAIESQPSNAANRYFLISGSFQELGNAEKFQSSLANQGMDAQIIHREPGPNSDFYKVSYRGFSNWNEALRELESERNTPGKEGVWLLVKK